MFQTQFPEGHPSPPGCFTCGRTRTPRQTWQACPREASDVGSAQTLGSAAGFVQSRVPCAQPASQMEHPYVEGGGGGHGCAMRVRRCESGISFKAEPEAGWGKCMSNGSQLCKECRVCHLGNLLPGQTLEDVYWGEGPRVKSGCLHRRAQEQGLSHQPPSPSCPLRVPSGERTQPSGAG